MTWTFSEAPGTDTAAGRRDYVRVLVGDTDTNDQLVLDESITAFLASSGNNVYSAAAIAARSIAGAFSRQSNASLDGARVELSERAKQYLSLANKLERDATKYGTGQLLGTVRAGGTTKSGLRDARNESDRVDAAFQVDQFRNPQGIGQDDYDRYD